VVRDVSRGRLLDRSAERRFASLPARERAWATEAAYGTIRLRGRLDALLRPYIADRNLDDVVRDVLRLGAYQLTEMGGVPDYAAVSETVDLARAAGRGRATGLVNAVLKRLAADGGTAEGAPDSPAVAADPLDALADRGSHPRWLLQRWSDRYGSTATAALVEANNRRPELYLRLVGMPRDDAIRRLAEAGIGAGPVPLEARSLRLEAGSDPVAALAAVPAVVQDPAASAVVRYADVPAGALVADLCAAPGGKSLALVDLGAGRVVSLDRSAERLRRVRDNARRVVEVAGGTPVPLWLAVADATRPALLGADAVLVDAPCTGTGTFRRHPDGRWRIGPDDLASLVRLQKRILRAAATAVAPGGLLVYATCSLEPEENEEQVERFLQEHPDFDVAPPTGPPPVPDAGGSALRILPHEHGVDGAFAVRMRRAR
jgi:16S rRNA (cytosine967-C5)-methyltransferase